MSDSKLMRDLYVIYDAVEEMLQSSEFEELNQFISQVQIEKCSVDLLLGILTATLPAKNRLPARERFFTLVSQSLNRRGSCPREVMQKIGLIADIEVSR